MSWHLECNGKKFYNKLEAIEENTKSAQPIRFNASDSYESHDFSLEPTQTLEQMWKAEVLEVRN